MLKAVLILSMLVTTLTPTANAQNAQSRDPGDEAKFKAVNFIPAAQLTEAQHRILTSYMDRPTSTLPDVGTGHIPFRGIDVHFDEWNQSYDGRAATFMAVTHALSKTIFTLLDGTEVTGIEMIQEMKRTKGDRIIVTLKKSLFDSWQANDGQFKFLLADGKTEVGNLRVTPGGSMSGSLHDGYDRQGTTSATKMPRLQINYRDSDSEADIDLDGYPVYKFGFIPNPNHLTWENSDVRYWYPKFVKKFGNPGFQVSEREKR